MFSRALLTLSVVALATPVIFASGADQAQAARMRFEAMDQNRDGVISRDEWQGSARSFQVHDWNGDGRLSGDEIRIGAQRNSDLEGADHNPGRAERFLAWTAAGFTSLDHNRDGRVTANEWHYDLETFRRADRNRDEALTRNEFLNADDAEWDDDRGDSFDDLDVNNNGRVERNEWHTGAAAFTWLDRNGDGVLSRFEVVGTQPSADTYDQFANLDVDRNGSLAQSEWHWSRNSFTQRDTNRDGRLTRREFDAAGGAPLTASGAGSQTVHVNAQQRWTDAMLDVRAGDTLTFDASGSIQMSDDDNDTATPAGSRRGRTAPDAPVLKQLAGGLIMRIDDYGPIFVGARRTITAPVSGRLYLGVNDDHLPDNRGELVVTVGVRGRTSR